MTLQSEQDPIKNFVFAIPGISLKQALLLLGVVELAVLAQHQPVVGGLLDHLRRPHDTAAGSVIATQGSINIQNSRANFIAAIIASCQKLSLFLRNFSFN
mgnify:CR=1 FL=1